MPMSRLLAAVASIALLAACQSTSIQSAWYDTSYRGGPFKKMVVIASDGTTADSRVFEDIFVQKLNAAGVVAVPGYTTVPPQARSAEGPFAAAVGATGADGVIIVRLLRVDTKTQVSTVMMPGPMIGPWGGFYGPGFYGGGFYPVPEVNQYDVAEVETNVYAVTTHSLVWAATTQTVNPTTVAQEAPSYADLIIAQMRARNLLPPGK
ncbi:MAG TPA: hypothetical protein VMN56_21280 [Casimicrobiaceae bacterium]|nr:hypothetical protein [Casimicrobiaceae bacterium]